MAPTPHKTGRRLPTVLRAGGVALAVLATGLLALWLWAASPSSLGQTLRWVGSWMERPEALVVEQAEGSLLAGGRIARLRWESDGLAVDLHGLDLGWTPRLWWDLLVRRELHLAHLRATQVLISDQRPATTEVPPAPTALTLPWLREVDLPFAIDGITWEGASGITPGTLQGRYAYGTDDTTPDAGPQHRLTIDALSWAQGLYRLDARLQALAPIRLSATLDGRLPATVPGGRALELRAQARVDGELAGAAPEVTVTARIATDPAASLHGAAPAQAPALDAEATLRPWTSQPVHEARVAVRHIDLAGLWPGAPATALSGHGTVRPTPGSDRVPLEPQWDLQAEVSNASPGPWDQARLPLKRLQVRLRHHAPLWHIEALDAELSHGQLQATGQVQWQANALGSWEGEVTAQDVRPSDLISTLPAIPFDLKARSRSPTPAGTAAAQATPFDVSLAPSRGTPSNAQGSPWPSLSATGAWQGQTVHLDRLQVSAWQASLDAQGSVNVAARDFNGKLAVQAPGADLAFEGHWTPAGLSPPGRAPATLRAELRDAGRLQRWVLATAHELDRMLPGLGVSRTLPATFSTARLQGRATAHGTWTGAPPWATLHSPGTSAQRLPWSLHVDVPDLELTLPAPTQDDPNASPTERWRIQAMQTTLQGQGMQASWQQTGRVVRGTWHTRIDLDAQGRLQATPAGMSATVELRRLQLQLDPLDQALRWQAQLGTATQLQWSEATGLTLAPGTVQLRPTRRRPGPAAWHDGSLDIAWSLARWQDGRLQTRGQMHGLALSWIDHLLASASAPQGPLAASDLQGDVLFGGQWEVDLPLAPDAGSRMTAPPARARLTLQRERGDLSVLAGDGTLVATGLSAASVALHLDRDALQAELRWDSERAGQVEAQLSTTLTPPGPDQPGWHWAGEAPLSGQLRATLPNIDAWSGVAPPGWRIQGRLAADARISGTRSRPRWHGDLQVDDLAVRSIVEGLDFSGGQLRARLQDDRIEVTSLRLRGAGGASGGLLLGSGTARWETPADGVAGPGRPVIDLAVEAQSLRLWARADRRLTVSGTATAQLQGHQLRLQGRLRADQALFLLPDETTPRLGSDVVVLDHQPASHSPPSGTARVVPDVTLDIDLGPDFQVRGQGLDTLLRGQLQLRSTPSDPAPRVLGEVRTARGSYRAYGQALTIETGLLRFAGPFDNPALDILALRPHPTQRVGVQITGTARAPRVRLYAQPDMPDSEKLAWLVLGRPASGTGAEAAILQQAALALLSGQGSASDGSLVRALGLDELSFQGESTQADGSTSAAAITLGKRLSNRLYVGYRRNLSGAMGTVSLFYDVSRRFTLRAQAGDDNAVDLIFTLSYD